jgi:hypothetical protein
MEEIERWQKGQGGGKREGEEAQGEGSDQGSHIHTHT